MKPAQAAVTLQLAFFSAHIAPRLPNTAGAERMSDIYSHRLPHKELKRDRGECGA